MGDQFNDLEMIAEVGHGVAMPSRPGRRPGRRPLRRAAGRPTRAPPRSSRRSSCAGRAAPRERGAAAPAARRGDGRLDDARGSLPRRRRGPGARRSHALERGRARGAADRHGLRARRRARRPRRSRAAVRGQAPAARQGRSCCSLADHRPGRRGRASLDAGRARPRRGVLAGRPDPGRAAAARGRAARRADRRRRHDRPPPAGPRRPAGAGRGRRPAAGDLGQPVRRAGPATDAADVVAQLGDAGDLAVILDGGPAAGGVASTVVDCAGGPPRILRAGAIPPTRWRRSSTRRASSTTWSLTRSRLARSVDAGSRDATVAARCARPWAPAGPTGAVRPRRTGRRARGTR